MSNNKQQTAVEKLESFFRRHCNPSVCDIEWNDFNTAFLEAKAMQKQQAEHYATFITNCVNNNLPTITFNDWINLDNK